MKHASRYTLFLFTIIAASATAVFAEEPARPWTDQANFGFVLTSGNSVNTNLVFSNKFIYTWTKSDFTLDAAALRAKSTTRTLAYLNGNVNEDQTSQLTAARYGVDGKYRYNFSDRFLGYARAGWFRDKVGGIQDRYIGGGGVGYRFLKSDVQNLIGELGIDYTHEKQVSGLSDNFAGARGFLGYDRALSKTSKFTSQIELLDNLKATPDWRGTWISAITASLSKKMALTVSYTLLYDNRPVVLEFSDPLGVNPKVAEFTFDKTDTILAVALVINF